MTDFTSGEPMRRRATRRSSAEYRLYFFCIFFFAIPSPARAGCAT